MLYPEKSEVPTSEPPGISFVVKLDQTLRDLAAALKAVDNLKWGVHGSCAARVRGATIIQPDDIDVLVTRLKPAADALEASGHFSFESGRPGGVQKFKHKHTQTGVDVADAQDFLPVFATSEVEGIRFFTLAESIVSLILRPERREKEMRGFAFLVLKKGDQLKEEEKSRIASVAKMKNWDDVVKNAKAAAAHYQIS
jgi:hypothetical protein